MTDKEKVLTFIEEALQELRDEAIPAARKAMEAHRIYREDPTMGEDEYYHQSEIYNRSLVPLRILTDLRNRVREEL